MDYRNGWIYLVVIIFYLIPLRGGSVTPDSPGLYPGPSKYVAKSPSTADSLKQQVDSLMGAYDSTGTPGAVIGVMHDGEVIFSKGYGMADLTHDIPITSQTRFNIASISKQFTAFAFALLEQKGALSLNDPVRKYIPSLSKFDETVTLKHLLTHSSGYREVYGTLALRGRIPSRDFLPREESIEVVRRQPSLEFTPGSKQRYNSTAYVMLALILERVTGEPFPHWMKTHVFDPLGMHHTVIESEVGQVISEAATSYSDGEDDSYVTAFSNRAIYGSAEIYTTVGDLARWMHNFNTAGVGGEAVQQKLRERFVLNNGDTTDYALGIVVDRARGLARFHHSGGHAGYSSKLNYYPGINGGVIVMSNYGNFDAGDKARKIARIFFGEHMTLEKEEKDRQKVSIDSVVLARYQGRYETEDQRIISFEHSGDRLILKKGSDTRYGLTAKSNTLFKAADENIRVRFQLDKKKEIKMVELTENGKVFKLQPLPEWNPTPADLQRYTGRYVSSELETIYIVSLADSQLVVKHRRLGKMLLTPEEAPVRIGTFATEEGSIKPRIRFEQNGVGIITGLYASLWRTENVWFQRRE